MDKIKNRIKFYLIGLSLGVIVVYFMFGNRGCAWLPGNRVKNMVGEKEIIAGDSILDIMKCLAIDNDAIYNLLKSPGDVEFSESVTDQNPKIYHIEGELEGDSYWVKFALYSDRDISEVVELYRENKTGCTSERSNYYKSTIPLPHDDVIAIIESHDMRVLDLANCQQQAYNLTYDSLIHFHTSAKIVIEKSRPRLSPNPYYVMSGICQGKAIEVKYEIGENFTRITEIKGEESTNCVEKE